MSPAGRIQHARDEGVVPMQVLYQPQGGLLLSERCIEAHVAVARQHGAQVHTGEAVLSWHEVPAQHGGEPDIIVVTSKAHYRTKRVVLTAGAWIPQLVPAMQVSCQCRASGMWS